VICHAHPVPFVPRIKTYPAKQRRVFEHIDLLFYSSVHLFSFPRKCKVFEAFPVFPASIISQMRRSLLILLCFLIVQQTLLMESAEPLPGTMNKNNPTFGDVLHEERRAYLLLFYNPEKAAQDQADMNDYLTGLYNDLENERCREYCGKDYDRFFTVTETPKRGRIVEPKEDAMREAVRNYGYFALLSNEVKDLLEALALYRSKDIVEKGFGNLKERLNFRRLQVSSELSLNGKIFV
jgi:hypothetical protein